MRVTMRRGPVSAEGAGGCTHRSPLELVVALGGLEAGPRLRLLGLQELHGRLGDQALHWLIRDVRAPGYPGRVRVSVLQPVVSSGLRSERGPRRAGLRARGPAHGPVEVFWSGFESRAGTSLLSVFRCAARACQAAIP